MRGEEKRGREKRESVRRGTRKDRRKEGGERIEEIRAMGGCVHTFSV